ncbi:hemin uptake protein HemP [Oxalobacteraceae bacterium OM1]|nr:hemin uptake protein HemP [Oxalobacteraceae bacterium OM1]
MSDTRHIDVSGTASSATDAVEGTVMRIKSEDLFAQRREVEIEHQGRIYRLRLTSLNKLILTA